MGVPHQAARLPSSNATEVAVLLNERASKVTGKVVERLRAQAGTDNVFLSKSELDARRIAREVMSRGYENVFLGGGDGTVACFINEIATEAATRRMPMPRFGILKLGTGNSVARYVNAAQRSGGDYLQDVRRANDDAELPARRVDMLLVEGKLAPFAGLGIDGQLLNDYNWLMRKLHWHPLSRAISGPIGYATSVVTRTLPHRIRHPGVVDCTVVNGRFRSVCVNHDGQQTIEPGEVMYRGPLMMAAAGTIPFFGFGLRMFPYAGTMPGHMNLRLGNVPVGTVLLNVRKLWRGQWFPDGLKDFLTREVTIEFSSDVPFQLAGDARGYRRKVKLGVAPQPIEVIDFGAVRN